MTTLDEVVILGKDRRNFITRAADQVVKSLPAVPKRKGLYPVRYRYNPNKWVSARTTLLLPSELMKPLEPVVEVLNKIPGFDKVAPALSPGNYVAALTEGSINPYRGAEIRANDERMMGAFLPLDFLSYGKVVPKAVKTVPKAVKAGILTTKQAALTGKKIINNLSDHRTFGMTGERLLNAIYDVSRLYDYTRTPGYAAEGHNYYHATPDLNKIKAQLKYGGNNVFMSYGKPWTERAFDNIIEIPAELFGDLSQVNMYGKPTGYSVQQAFRLMTGLEKLTMPSYLLNSVEAGRNLTVISPSRINDVLRNGKYSTIYYAADPLLPYGAIGKPFIPSNTQNTGLTSLRFFERKPSRISTAESNGATKWERNFKPKLHVANYPGYLLKGLMKGSLLERLLSKNGTININLLNAYFNKASQIEKEVANKVLNEKFAGLKTIDYNLFKKAVLDELVTYTTKPQTRYSTYGMDRLGFNVIKEPDGAGGILEYVPGVRTNTFTFESPKIPVGNAKHYDPTTLGHSRTYTTPEELRVLHVMESQSDWALKFLGLTKAEKAAIQNIDEQLRTGTPTGFSTLEELQVQKQAILDRASQRTLGISYLSLYLHDNYLQRQLQENLRYAAENGLTKMRYPTSETAAKIEGYLSKTGWFTPEGKEIDPLTSVQFNPITGNFEAPAGTVVKQVYSPEHQTILKKYADFPKLFLKLYKGQNVRTATDAKGNTWYEVDVPKGYLSREWQFKQGGKLIKKSVPSN